MSELCGLRKKLSETIIQQMKQQIKGVSRAPFLNIV